MTIPNPPLSSIATPHVKRINNDYKLSVPFGGNIFLDTGTNAGLVYITGDLTVQGNTTTVNTTNMTIEDNILVLNKGESGSGVTLLEAGIEIDRGIASNGNARLLWIETPYQNPVTNVQDHGYFIFQTKTNGNLSAIKTNSIETNGQNLALINRGTGVITVTGTTNYERQVLDYNNNLLPFDKDIIPNMQAVIDKINLQISSNPASQIKKDDTRIVVYDNNIASSISNYDTGGIPNNIVTVNHNLATNGDLNVYVGGTITIVNSQISGLDGTWTVVTANLLDLFFTISLTTTVTLSNRPNEADRIYVNGYTSSIISYVDGNKITDFRSGYVDIFNLNFSNTTISTTSGTDLILISGSIGSSVQIQDDLRLQHLGVTPTNTSPTYVNDSVKIYSDIEGAGNTGIYYVGPTSSPGPGYRRDELISKKKAIAFSILM